MHFFTPRCFACLQVMGAHLSSQRRQEYGKKIWHEALEMLQSAADLPAGQEQLFASLRKNYEALDRQQRCMFLDAAFFFLGRRADTAKHAWHGYDGTAGKSSLISSVCLQHQADVTEHTQQQCVSKQQCV